METFISPPFTESSPEVQAAVNKRVADAIDAGRHCYFLTVEDRVVITDTPFNVLGGIYLNLEIHRSKTN